jgi:hypothetical protein
VQGTRVCRVPECAGYPSVQGTRVCRVPECAGYPSVQGTRVRRVPECAGYPSMQGTRVCRVPECAGYPSMQGTRVCRVPECAGYPSMQGTRVPESPCGRIAHGTRPWRRMCRCVRLRGECTRDLCGPKAKHRKAAARAAPHDAWQAHVVVQQGDRSAAQRSREEKRREDNCC